MPLRLEEDKAGSEEVELRRRSELPKVLVAVIKDIGQAAVDPASGDAEARRAFLVRS